MDVEAMDLAALESDARLERMDRVAVLYGEITAATREFLRAVAACDRHGDWAEAGFASCADWLAWRIGISRMTASEKVRAARALEDLPLISAAMDRGEISFSKVRALTRVATPESEAELLEFARAGSTASLERLVRGWKTMDRAGEQRVERLSYRLRSFSVFPDGEGMYLVRGRLTPEVAAVLMRAVEAASDALYAKGADRDHRSLGAARADECSGARDDVRKGARDADRHDGRDDDGHGGRHSERPDPEQRRADAIGLLAERALAVGFAGDDAPISGSRAERYQVVVHVGPETLRAQGEPGMSELEDVTPFSAENSRRFACDASVVEVVKGPDGSVLDVGRRRRTISPALRRALEARDRGCRFPGCGLRFADAHHIEHWADGGETSLKNTVLLCRRHHRLVHEEGHRVFSDPVGQVVFYDPRGRPIAASAPPTTLGVDPLADLVAGNRARGVEPDWRSGMPAWKRDRDIPFEIAAAALEAWDSPSSLEPTQSGAA
jgi:hypothetical protein